MEPDAAMVRLARRKAVHLLWGDDNPVRQLEEMSRRRGMAPALDAERISREVLAVSDGLIRLGHAEDADPTSLKRIPICA